MLGPPKREYPYKRKFLSFSQPRHMGHRIGNVTMAVPVTVTHVISTALTVITTTIDWLGTGSNTISCRRKHKGESPKTVARQFRVMIKKLLACTSSANWAQRHHDSKARHTHANQREW